MNLGITLSAALFILVLFVSAWFDKSIRLLHLAEAAPYIAGPWLASIQVFAAWDALRWWDVRGYPPGGG